MFRKKVKNFIGNPKVCQNIKIIMAVKIGIANKNSFIFSVNRNNNYSYKNRKYKEEN